METLAQKPLAKFLEDLGIWGFGSSADCATVCLFGSAWGHKCWGFPGDAWVYLGMSGYAILKKSYWLVVIVATVKWGEEGGGKGGEGGKDGVVKPGGKVTGREGR